MGAVKETATKVLKTVAKTTKKAVEGAVAIARAVRGREEREGGPGRGGRESSQRRTTHRRGGADGREERSTSTASSAAPSPETAEEEAEPAEEQPDLDAIWGVGEARADALRDLGFETVSDVAEASVEDLQELSGVGESTAKKMKESAGELSG